MPSQKEIPKVVQSSQSSIEPGTTISPLSPPPLDRASSPGWKEERVWGNHHSWSYGERAMRVGALIKGRGERHVILPFQVHLHHPTKMTDGCWWRRVLDAWMAGTGTEDVSARRALVGLKWIPWSLCHKYFGLMFYEFLVNHRPKAVAVPVKTGLFK